MARFSANLSFLFPDRPFLDRFAAAAAAGFKAVEYMFPYVAPADRIAALLAENRLEPVLFNMPPGNWEQGERGIACHPDRVKEFRDGVETALSYATKLGVPRINCLAGIAPKAFSREAARATLIENVRFAAAALSPQKIDLMIEPVSFYDIPGFLLNRTSDAIAVMDEVGAENVKLQYDVYHMQRMEGELAATIERLLGRIGHIQIADNPGRHEPGTGEINYPFLFRLLDRIGYKGWIGCEYVPLNSTEAGLGWLTA